MAANEGTPNVAEGYTDSVSQDYPQFVGITPLPSSMEDKDAKGRKRVIRKIEDELLMVVPTRMYGKEVRALIDSGTTRCFVSPTSVTTARRKGIPRDFSLN